MCGSDFSYRERALPDGDECECYGPTSMDTCTLQPNTELANSFSVYRFTLGRSQWTGLEANNLTYYFRIETGEVRDVAGNDMLIVVTEGYHTIKIDTEGDAN